MKFLKRDDRFGNSAPGQWYPMTGWPLVLNISKYLLDTTDDNLPQEGRLLITDEWKNCFGRSVRTDTRPWLLNKLGPRRERINHSDPAWHTHFLPTNLMSRVFFKLPIIHNKALLRAARDWNFAILLSPPRELFNPRDICLAFVLSLCDQWCNVSLNFKNEAKYEIKRQIGTEDTDSQSF